MRIIIIAAMLALTALACSNQESPEPVTQVPIQEAGPTRASAPAITAGEPAATRTHLPQPEEGTEPSPPQAHPETPIPFRIQGAEREPPETGAAAPAREIKDTTITLTGALTGMTITNDDDFPTIPQEDLEQLALSIRVLAEAPEPVSPHITRISPFFQVEGSTEHPLEITYPVNPAGFPEAPIQINLYHLREKNSIMWDKWEINGEGTLQGTRTNPTYVHREPGLGGTYFFGYQRREAHMAHDPSGLPLAGPQAPIRIRLDPPNAPITVNPNEPMPAITVRVTRADGSTTVLDHQDPDLSFKTDQVAGLKVEENRQLAWEEEPEPFHQENITAAYQGLTAKKTITEKLPIATLPQVSNECWYQRPSGEAPIKANRVVIDVDRYSYWGNTQRGSAEFQTYGKRREKPQKVISFQCNSAEDFRQFHQDLRANPRVRYQEPYLPSQAEEAVRALEAYHDSGNLSEIIPIMIQITQQDGITRGIGEGDLPNLAITSSDESVIRINQEGQPEAVRVGRADLNINLGGKDTPIRDIPAFPIAIDEQCRLWSYDLAGARIPEFHVTGYMHTDPRFQAEPPIPPEILEEIAHSAGWADIRTEGENKYQAILGLDCDEEPRRTVKELMGKLEKTWEAMEELIPETKSDLGFGSITTGDMNARPFLHALRGVEDNPMQWELHLQSQDDLVELQPIQALASRFDPETGLHFEPNRQEQEKKTELTTQTPEIIMAGLDGNPRFAIRAGTAKLTLKSGEHTVRKEFQVHEQPEIRVDLEPRCAGEIMGARYAQDQILVRLQDSVENQDEFIWALAGSRKVRGDVIGRGDDGWYIIRTVCPEEDRPETAFATALFLLTDSHKYVRNAAPRSLP